MYMFNNGFEYFRKLTSISWICCIMLLLDYDLMASISYKLGKEKIDRTDCVRNHFDLCKVSSDEVRSIFSKENVLEILLSNIDMRYYGFSFK